MAVPQNFRSAFHGFNREDVVNYIEYLNAKHTAEVNQLTSENEFLQEKLEGSTPSPMLAELVAERDSLKQQVEELEARCEQLEQGQWDAPIAASDDSLLLSRIAALEAELKAAEKARDEALLARSQTEVKQPVQYRMEQELEFYRRAERIERQARERAEQVYRLSNGALADATAQVDEAAASIGELADRVSEQLALLQNAVAGSKQSLRSAAATMYAIRTGEE